MFLAVFEFLSLAVIAVAISIQIEHITKMRSLVEEGILIVLSHGEHYPTEFLERNAVDSGIPAALFKRALRRLIVRKEIVEGYHSTDTFQSCVKLRDGSPYATCPRPLPEWAKKQIRESFVSAEVA